MMYRENLWEKTMLARIFTRTTMPALVGSAASLVLLVRLARDEAHFAQMRHLSDLLAEDWGIVFSTLAVLVIGLVTAIGLGETYLRARSTRMAEDMDVAPAEPASGEEVGPDVGPPRPRLPRVRRALT